MGINNKIKELREQSGLTLKQVAEFIGCSVATAQRYESENGIKNIPYDAIAKYAELFNVSPSYIIGWKDITQSFIATPPYFFCGSVTINNDIFAFFIFRIVIWNYYRCVADFMWYINEIIRNCSIFFSCRFFDNPSASCYRYCKNHH